MAKRFLWKNLGKSMVNLRELGVEKAAQNSCSGCSGCSVSWKMRSVFPERVRFLGKVIRRWWTSLTDNLTNKIHRNQGFPRAYYYNYYINI